MFIASAIVVAVVILSLDIPKPVDSADILVVLFIASKSHKNVFDPLLHELAERGHSITVISPIKSSKEIPNIRNINGNPNITFMPNPFLTRVENEKSNMGSLLGASSHLAQACREYFENPEVMDLKHSHFDLVMTSTFVNDCSFGFIDHFKAPLIIVSSVTAAGHVAALTGTPQPPSFVPFLMSGFTDRMNFPQRVKNFLAVGVFSLIRNYYLVPPMETLYREYFPNAPGIHDFEKNISLVLSNGHFTLNYPRPMMPDIIDVGGMHIRPAKSLSKELDDFISGSGKHGFIYFSLGSIVKGSEMPDHIRNAFLNTFSKLKQRVIWKWESEEMEGVPPNVKLSKWLPQQDILGHPNIKLFITHGGLLSTQEAVYFGVPIIGIPLFGDQGKYNYMFLFQKLIYGYDWNMKQSENAGFALTLELRDINEQRLLNVISRVLTEIRFPNQAEKLSKLFRDQIDKPLDRAVFWTEYVIRHKGAPHMRSGGRYLNFFQYYSVDVLAVLLASVFGTLFILYSVIAYYCRKGKSGSNYLNSTGTKKIN